MSERRYQAVVFDMDGVLVDSEPAFHEAVNELLAPIGKQVPWEDYLSLIGTSTSHTWRGVLQIVGLDPAEAQPYAERYGDTLLEVLGRKRELLPGVRELLDELRARGLPAGMATSSRQAWVEALMGGVGLPIETFDAVVWREQVERGKPAPDLYLRAAELIAVAPELCIAIEDTPTGIEAERAAGMFAVQ
ncbi:MAG: HAD family phosphatase, partial [Dehalococcoidia bacterium]